jgi:hypothetical protein
VCTNGNGVSMYTWKLEARLLSRCKITRRRWLVKEKRWDECWEYTGGKGFNGYGHTSWNSKMCLVHRLAYWLWKMKGKGKIGKWKIRHTCDNPICFNPVHLVRGTSKQNQQDSKKRCRMRKAKGEDNGVAKLTEHFVRKMRALYSKGVSTVELGVRFGVTRSNASYVCNRHTWKHLA